MYTKAKIFNLALGALLLTKKIADTDTDTSIENQVLNVQYDSALRSTLEDLDLDATATQKVLELIELNPNDLWDFAYKYPTNCTSIRRIQSHVVKDNRSTQIKRRIANHNGMKVIFCNEPDAIAEYVASDVGLNTLSANAGMAVAFKLAWLSAPLVAGKGAVQLRKDIQANYLLAKAEAQEHDRMENANFDDDEVTSEFVEVRIS